MSRWGRAWVKVKRWCCRRCEQHGHSHQVGLDGSGLSPAVLESVIYLGSHLSYRESQEALRLGRIELSLGQCEQKHHGYAACYERACKTQLKKQAEGGLAAGGGRDWVLEIDGMFVMERDKPFKGRCEGREVKQSVLYPLGAPHERHYLTSRRPGRVCYAQSRSPTTAGRQAARPAHRDCRWCTLD